MLLVCAGALELLEGGTVLLLVVVEAAMLVDAVVEVRRVVLVTEERMEVSVVIEVGRVVFAPMDVGTGIGVSTVSVLVGWGVLEPVSLEVGMLLVVVAGVG